MGLYIVSQAINSLVIDIIITMRYRDMSCCAIVFNNYKSCRLYSRKVI